MEQQKKSIKIDVQEDLYHFTKRWVFTLLVLCDLLVIHCQCLKSWNGLRTRVIQG